MDKRDGRQVLFESWYEEQQSAYLYDRLADAERGSRYENLFRELARAARQQAAWWEKRLVETSAPVPSPYQPDMRSRIVARLIAWCGARRIKPVLAAMKVRGLSVYSTHPQPTPSGHTLPTTAYQQESGHRGLAGGGNLRAAVFGVNDGLLSNASLILGVAGAATDTRTILLTGIAGLAAGAFSMAAGEYVSVRSQRELFERQIGLERSELAEYPEEEAEELALIYIARGIPQEDAHRLATQLISDPEHALNTLAREELGLNPGELGSPWGAAFSSFAAFATGGVIPLVPYLFLAGPDALAISVSATAVSLFGIGASLSLFTGRSAWASGFRMLGIGALAGATTFAIGHLFGVSTG